MSRLRAPLLGALAAVFWAQQAIAQNEDALTPQQDEPVAAFPQGGRFLEQDGNVWVTTQFFHPLDERVTVGFAFNGRLTENASNPRRLRGRVVGYYQYSDQVRLWLGVDRIEEANPRGLETRTWQQLQYSFEPRGRWSGDARVRTEQRFIGGVGGPLWRTRLRLNGYYELGQSNRWYLRNWNELFVYNNTRKDFDKNTFDQHRVFAGLGFRPISDIRMEAGYQVRYFDRPDRGDRVDHILFLQMYYRY